MLKVLATDNVSKSGLQTLSGEKNIQLDIKLLMPRDTLKKEIAGYQAILIRGATTLDREILECASKLELIIRAGVGIDNVDVAYATQRGILVANTPKGNATTTAEHAFALLTALCRHVARADQSVKNKKWEKKAFVGTELKGKTLGLIGLGNIGSVVAKIANGYSMRVLVYDPYVSADYAQGMSAEKAELDDLLGAADAISLHVPLNDATRHMIDARALARMKPTAFLVNCARGGIVDEQALCEALKNQKLRGAAMDVFEHEPIDPDHPLLALDNVILTPHLGASTQEAQEMVAMDACHLLKEYARHGMVSSAINSSLRFKEASAAQGAAVTLAEKIGLLQGQVLEGVPQKLTVEIWGEEFADMREFIYLHAAMMFMRVMCGDDRVNTVNVRHYLDTRGVELVCSEIKGAPGRKHAAYASLVRCEVESQTSEGELARHSVSGTVFGNHHPRIVELDGYYFELVPEGHVLLIYNEDKPGVIGHVGTVLGKHKINISRLSVNLQRERADALSVYTVETTPSPRVMEEIMALESIRSCKHIRF